MSSRLCPFLRRPPPSCFMGAYAHLITAHPLNGFGISLRGIWANLRRVLHAPRHLAAVLQDLLFFVAAFLDDFHLRGPQRCLSRAFGISWGLGFGFLLRGPCASVRRVQNGPRQLTAVLRVVFFFVDAPPGRLSSSGASTMSFACFPDLLRADFRHEQAPRLPWRSSCMTSLQKIVMSSCARQ